MEFVVIKRGNEWMDEDGNFTPDRMQAKAMPYPVAEAYILSEYSSNYSHYWIEPAEVEPTLRMKWLAMEAKFLSSFYEPGDTTMFPGWLTKQINNRLDKIEKLKRGVKP